jgi:sugar fermentation stimulation protein A
MRTPGTYLLILQLDTPARIHVGSLGEVSFPEGWYVYVGSALSGLEARVARHLRPSSVRHWHVDYLRAEAAIRDAILLPGSERRECDLAKLILALPGASAPAPRFGASDCRCSTHLIHFTEIPSLDGLQ